LELFAASRRAWAMIRPPVGPRPLLLRIKWWKERFVRRKGTMGSAQRPPKALSERSRVSRVVVWEREVQRAVRAVGISEMRRPVKMSAKSAI
jgi:hypothetical protein